MSRSYKKPYIKDVGTEMKRISHRMERRIVRQLLKPWRYKYWWHVERSCFGCDCREWEYVEGMEFQPVCEFDHLPMEPLLPLRKQIVDSYDICDYKLHRPDEPYYYRK